MAGGRSAGFTRQAHSRPPCDPYRNHAYRIQWLIGLHDRKQYLQLRQG